MAKKRIKVTHQFQTFITKDGAMYVYDENGNVVRVSDVTADKMYEGAVAAGYLKGPEEFGKELALLLLNNGG